MKQKFTLLISILILSIQTIWAMDDDRASSEIRVFHYSALADSAEAMTAEFKRVGYIAVEGVPGFAEAYEAFLEQARQFVTLPPAEQAKCTPDDYFSRGWSRGSEVFYGQTDTYKGSYYAQIPNVERNVWPTDSVPGFEKAYATVAGLILSVGQEILPHVGFKGDTAALARMLHYKSVPESEEDGNPNWCGVHRDHGIITGLCPEVFYRDGKMAARPEGSGLYIEGAPVAPAKHIMLFQMGEVMELLTNGKVRATDHWVVKAKDGLERFALAVFFDPLDEFAIHCDDAEVVAKYTDRFTDGISYKEWGDRSYAKYNPKSLAPTVGVASEGTE